MIFRVELTTDRFVSQRDVPNIPTGGDVENILRGGRVRPILG